MYWLRIGILSAAIAEATSTTAAAADRALTYTARLEQSITEENGKTKREPAVIVRTTGRGTDARAEVIEGDKDLQPGYSLLANAGGRRLYIINPNEHEYKELSPATFELEAATIGKAFKLDVVRSNVKVEDLGAGEKVAGLPTRHFRMTRELDGTVSVSFFKEKLLFEENIEYWFSAELGEIPNPLAAVLTSGTGMFPSIHAETRAKYAHAMTKLPGLNPVRMSYSATETNGKGKRKLTFATLTISDPRPATTDVVSFELPSNFKRKKK